MAKPKPTRTMQAKTETPITSNTDSALVSDGSGVVETTDQVLETGTVAETAQPRIPARGETAHIQMIDESPFVAAAEMPTPKTRGPLWQRLDKYLDVMTPNRSVSMDDILRQQVAMHAILHGLLVREQDDAVAIDSARELIATFREHKDGALGPRYVMRYFDQVRMSQESRNEFEALVYILMDAAVSGQPKVDWTAFKARLNPEHAEMVVGRLQRAMNIQIA